ncbi:MAG: HemK2/MTQ2 family protein methyltransferase, partial [Chloroflexota bacterium]
MVKQLIRWWGRLWYRLRFLLFQRHRFDRLVLEWVAGRPFLILPQVFNPALFWTSEFMAQALNERLIPPGSHVLDMGTGSGIGAVFAAQWTDKVTAVDVNPAAVRCARINVLLNEVEACVLVKEGDLFTAVSGETFDVILFNPPYFSGLPKSDLDRAFRANDVIERFGEHLQHHLKPDGQVLLLLSSEGDETYFLNLFRQHGYQIKVEARQQLPTETLSL